jgi:hypothetical protein
MSAQTLGNAHQTVTGIELLTVVGVAYAVSCCGSYKAAQPANEPQKSFFRAGRAVLVTLDRPLALLDEIGESGRPLSGDRPDRRRRQLIPEAR